MQNYWVSLRLWAFGLAILLSACASQSQTTRDDRHQPETTDEEASVNDRSWTFDDVQSGISLSLPDERWVASDLSQGPVAIFLFSPDPEQMPSCTVMSFPAAIMPAGLLSREHQLQSIAGETYQRTSYGESELADLPGETLEYTIGPTEFVLYGAQEGDRFVILQLGATSEQWQTTEVAEQFESIRVSIGVHDVSIAAPSELDWDLSPADEVRARRRAAELEGGDERALFEVVHHDLLVTIDPVAGRLEAIDELEIQSSSDGVSEISLNTTLVTIEEVAADVALSWHVEEEVSDDTEVIIQHLLIELENPLANGETVRLTVRSRCDDFIQLIDSELIAEVSVLGQVRETSSYSSHVLYYPIDDLNSASADITLRVPTGYQAVSGGTLVDTSVAEEQTRFRYRWDHRLPNLLPFGFAVAHYLSESALTEGGLQITIYGIGERARVEERLELAIEAANLFERTMGPLPWSDVRIAQVSPVEREMGVSLPGLILISDGFWNELHDVALADGATLLSENLDLLVVVDELAHQWNAYRTPLPNELAEGISTFTNALYLEHRVGREAYDNIIDYLTDIYVSMAGVGREVAIADPEIYETPSYRFIAFIKVPLVLDMLRTQLGDEVFFRAWRALFVDSDGSRANYDTMQHTFEQASEQDLSGFFDQWFFRAGRPQLRVETQQDGPRLLVTLLQVQPGQPYRLDAEILVRGAAGETIRETVTLSEATTVVEVECDFELTEIVFDPDNRVLAEILQSDSISTTRSSR